MPITPGLHELLAEVALTLEAEQHPGAASVRAAATELARRAASDPYGLVREALLLLDEAATTSDQQHAEEALQDARKMLTLAIEQTEAES